MRFLVDRCAGVTLAKWLRDQGHDVEDASGWSEDPGDAAILQTATDEGSHSGNDRYGFRPADLRQ